MATALHKTRTIDFKNLALQFQQLKDNSGNAIDITELTDLATELALLDGLTATAAELNVLDTAVAGTVVASKGVVVDSSKNITEFGSVGMTSAVVDGITMSPLKWVDVAVAASVLDSGGTVDVVAAVSGDRYKVREIILVGGGTNYGSGGDRLISLTDGTNVYTTIANADIEAAPAASLRWGNAKVPFLTSISGVESVSGQAIRFAYSGGTTDHSATGTITFSVCVEKTT